MLNNLWTTLKALAASRKVMLAVISMIVFGVGKLGIELDTAAVTLVVAPLWVAIFGIAIEDAAGKKAAALIEVARISLPIGPTSVVVNQPGLGAQTPTEVRP